MHLTGHDTQKEHQTPNLLYSCNWNPQSWIMHIFFNNAKEKFFNLSDTWQMSNHLHSDHFYFNVTFLTFSFQHIHIFLCLDEEQVYRWHSVTTSTWCQHWCHSCHSVYYIIVMFHVSIKHTGPEPEEVFTSSLQTLWCCMSSLSHCNTDRIMYELQSSRKSVSEDDYTHIHTCTHVHTLQYKLSLQCRNDFRQDSYIIRVYLPKSSKNGLWSWRRGCELL